MTKQDLRSGMVVELKNGKRYLVIAETLQFVGLHEHMEYASHSDDLTFGFGYLNVEKVYNPGNVTFSEMIEHPTNLIWERKVVKELTVKEIEHLLGYSVKIVKE